MIIALTHPNHGTHIAYSEQEAISCEANGWVRDAKMSDELAGKPVAQAPERIQEEAGAPLSPQERYIAKFGHPPHHRMKDETIIKQLEE